MGNLRCNRHKLKITAILLCAMLFSLCAGAQSIVESDNDILTYAGFTATGGCDSNVDDILLEAVYYHNLVDGVKNDHCWLCMSSGKSVPSGETESCYWVDFQADNPIFVASYVLSNSSRIENHPFRIPTSWILKAKRNEEDSWTTIATVAGCNTPAENNLDTNYALDEPGTYKFFRFMVTKVKGGDDYPMEVGELRFRDKIILPTPTGLSASLTAGDGARATLGWSSDGGATKWEVCVDDEVDHVFVTTNECDFTNLESGKTHNFKVRSWKESSSLGIYGVSAWSSVCYFFTTDDTSVTVCSDGASTTESTPVFGWGAANENLPKTQFIIPSSEIGVIASGNYINSLLFYSEADSVDLGTARFVVYIGELENESFVYTGANSVDFVDWSSLTSVYEGSLTIENHTLHLVFDKPYQYRGGNLLIGFYQTEPGNRIHTYWYGKETVHYESDGSYFPGEYTDGSYSYYGYYLPKTTIVYTEDPPTVLRPTNLTCTLTPGDGSVAKLDWVVMDSATSWEICVNDDEEHLITSTETSCNMSGLTPDVTYTAKVRSVSGDERSLWSEPVTFTPTDYYWLTLYDGTDINNNIPIHQRVSYFNVYSKSQFIIPSGVLSSVAGSYISRLSFYSADLKKDWGESVFDVYLLTTTQTVFSNAQLKDWDNSNWKKVYSGCLFLSDHKMEIIFDTPFHYEGQNLMIGVNQTEEGSTPNCRWYGEAQSGNTAIGGYILYGDESLALEKFLPKTTIHYSLEDPRAIKVPKHLEVSYTGGSTADVSWISTESAWNLILKDVLEGDSVVIENVSSPYTLTDLEYGKKYEVRVQSVREDSDFGTVYSDWTDPVGFITDLAADGDWCKIGFYLTDTSGDGWSGNAIRLEDVLTGKEISAVSNSSDTGAGEEQAVYVDVPVGRRINFVWVKGENPVECSWRVLDVNRDEICSSEGIDVASLETDSVLAVYRVDCTISPWKKPTELTARPLVSMVYINWTENSDPAATSWVLAYKADSDENFVEVLVSENPSTTLTDLTPETTYTVKVRPYTGEDGVMKWSEDVQFTMNAEYLVPCDLAATVDSETATGTLSWSGNSASYNIRYRKVANFFEDFSNGIPSFWSRIDADGDGHGWFDYTYEVDGDPIDGLVVEATYPASESYNNDGKEDLTPDNWLVTPLIPLKGTVKVYARGHDKTFYEENFAVYLSTSGKTVDDFKTELIPEKTTEDIFKEYTADLSKYEGQSGYIAIRHFDPTENNLMLLLDQFGLYESNEWTEITNVESLSTLVEDLDANSLYEFQVQGISPDQPEGTDWSAVCSFFSYYGSYTMKGDVNRDGKLDVQDVTALVNIIQQRANEEYHYDYDAADLNSDGEYNVIDVTMLINLIQGR